MDVAKEVSKSLSERIVILKVCVTISRFLDYDMTRAGQW